MMLMSSASAAISNNDIASIAIGYNGQDGGQCKEFVQKVVNEVAGEDILGSGYKNCYEKIGMEILPSQAMWGDIIQTRNDSDPENYYSGTHSAIVLENKGDNNFKVVDSNWNIIPDEIVRIGDRNLFDWASGFGTQIHYYRLGTTDHWDFNISPYTQGWEAINAEEFSVNSGKYIVNPKQIDPYIRLNGLLLNADNYDAIEINMASNCPDGNATIYFTTENSSNYAEDKNVSFEVNNSGDWFNYTIYMANHELWNGTVTGIRIDPAEEGRSSGVDTFGFDWIKVVETDKKPTIVSCDLDDILYQGSDTLTFGYWIKNPFANDLEDVRLGAQIRTSNPLIEWIDDSGNDKVITLNSGIYEEQRRYERFFKLPIFASAGDYDANWIVLKHKTGVWYNNKEKANAFVIGDLSPKPKLDLIFLFDTTGSMWDDIANAQASASMIVSALDLTGFDYRVAVADYRDYPENPHGEPGIDYVYNLDQSFSSDKDVIISAIDGLTLGWGNDWNESVYSALVMAMLDVNKDTANSDNYGWREEAFKAIILLGDAPPQDDGEPDNREPWIGGYNLDDVAYWSENIDPIRVYSIVVGSDPNTYAAFSEISERTGGKVYLSPNADDVSAAIIKAIEDMEDDGYGVEVEITPIWNETDPGSSVIYSVNITNKGDLADVYNVSFEAENIMGSDRGYPLAIQYSWITFNDSEMGLNPSMSEIRSLEISVPENWAGMENTTYTFGVNAKSETDADVSNTSSAELKVKASKRSMVEYSRLEIQWLTELVNGSDIHHGTKNALLIKLANAELKVDQALVNLDNGKEKPADNMLRVSQNLMNAFINQVEAQCDKKITQPDTEVLKGKANQTIDDLEKAREE